MRVHCGFVCATSSVVYVPVPSVYYMWFFPDTRPYGYAARHAVAVTSFTEGHYVPTTRSCYKCVCVLHMTWPPLHVLNICPCAYCRDFVLATRPCYYIPECIADDFVNYCCFYNNSPQHDPAFLSTLKAWIFLQSQTCTKQYALPASCTYF